MRSKTLQAAIQSCFDIIHAIADLGGNVEVFPRNAGFLDSDTDFLFGAVEVSAVEMPVALHDDDLEEFNHGTGEGALRVRFLPIGAGAEGHLNRKKVSVVLCPQRIALDMILRNRCVYTPLA